MTNDPGNFLPLAGFGGFNYLTAGTQPSQKGVAPARRNTCRLWDQRGDPQWMGRGELIIYGFPQGFNHPEGDFSLNSDGFDFSDLVTLRNNEVLPPPTVLSLGDSAITANYVGFHTAYAHSTLFMGIGPVSGHSLFKETSTTDPTPVATAYNPGGGTQSICSLTRTLTSGAERLMVGRVGAAAQLISDSSGTVATTMHNNTASMWGGILSGVNAVAAKAGVPQLNLYYGTNLGYLSSDATMTDAPTNTHTVNAGGFAIGAIKPAGRAQMCFWAIPKVSNTSGALLSSAEAFCDIYATPMDMSADILPIDLSYFLPNGILGAVPFRDGILAHDGTHIVYWDGDKAFELGIFRQRTASSNKSTPTLNHDIVNNIRGLIVNGAECGCIYQWYGGANGKVRAEMYNWEHGTWHNATTEVATAETTLVTVLSSGTAMSPSGQRYWLMSVNGGTETISGFFIPRANESLLWQHSIGSGSTTTTAMPFFTHNLTLRGCNWSLDAEPPGTIPGTKTIARMPKVIYECEFNGDLDYGGTDWSFKLEVYGNSAASARQLAYNQTFEPGMPQSHYVRKNPPSAWANITNVQLVLTCVASGTSRKSAQFVPFTVRFAYSKDGRQITEQNAPMLKGEQKVS